ncbi:LacI family DNA-binding transcriptional regulator [Tessaracoccus coleopterorum]|uniref:LacI family DNA-binding transcriptional regulator n=1 Tax=Tessaracoccus coleopterorum TaxID=2714950 RepID=UPI002F919C55
MDSRRRPTMADVARAAGVSLKTVSRVVNGVPTVDAGRVARVNRAIGDLGYRHNLVAAGLKAGSGTRLIGLITADISDPFFGSVAAAVDAVARSRGFGVLMTGSTESPEAERGLVLDLCARQVRG